MIDRYLLRYFLAVVEHGTFTRAAAACSVSQPTLSVGIAKLETACDCPLFRRSNRRVELTIAGNRLLEYARRIESDFKAVENIVRADAPLRLIRIGVVPTIPAVLIGRALAAAIDGRAIERFEIIEGRSRELEEKLKRGQVDVVLGPMSGTSNTGSIITEPYCVAFPARHRLAGRRSVSAEELADEPMIVRRQCEVLPSVSRFFTDCGVRPFMAARTINDEQALAYVRAGLGITVMPRCFTANDIAMLRLDGFDAMRTVGLHIDPDAVGRLAASPGFLRFSQTFQRSLCATT